MPATSARQHHRHEHVFRNLHAQQRERLERFVLRHTGHAGDAEELTQQTFAEAARTYDSFRGESQLSTWLFGIAMNLVRNHLSRSPQRQHRFEDDSALAELPGHDADPEQQCGLSELVRLLDAEMQALLPEMREVLMMVSVHDISYEDAAQQLALPVGTVRSRVSRARSQLRRRMQACGATLPF